MPGVCRTRNQGVLPLHPKFVDSARSTPPELSRGLNGVRSPEVVYDLRGRHPLAADI
jgi:hypothetical protein